MPDERFDSRPTGEPRVPEASSRCVTSLCHVDDQETGFATASQPCPIGRTPSAMSTVLLTRWAEGSCHADQEGIAADPCGRVHTIVAGKDGRRRVLTPWPPLLAARKEPLAQLLQPRACGGYSIVTHRKFM